MLLAILGLPVFINESVAFEAIIGKRCYRGLIGEESAYPRPSQVGQGLENDAKGALGREPRCEVATLRITWVLPIQLPLLA